jgi:hypothetical protein
MTEAVSLERRPGLHRRALWLECFTVGSAGGGPTRSAPWPCSRSSSGKAGKPSAKPARDEHDEDLTDIP